MQRVVLMIDDLRNNGSAVELPGKEGRWIPRAEILADASDSPVDDVDQAIDDAEDVGLLTTTEHDGREYAQLTERGIELVESAAEGDT